MKEYGKRFDEAFNPAFAHAYHPAIMGDFDRLRVSWHRNVRSSAIVEVVPR